MLGIEVRGSQDNVLVVERAVALANRHCRLPRVVPHGGESIDFGIEAGDSGAGALRSVRTEKDKILPQKLAVLDHILLSAFRHDRLPVHREERLDDRQSLAGQRRLGSCAAPLSHFVQFLSCCKAH